MMSPRLDVGTLIEISIRVYALEVLATSGVVLEKGMQGMIIYDDGTDLLHVNINRKIYNILRYAVSPLLKKTRKIRPRIS